MPSKMKLDGAFTDAKLTFASLRLLSICGAAQLTATTTLVPREPCKPKINPLPTPQAKRHRGMCRIEYRAHIRSVVPEQRQCAVEGTCDSGIDLDIYAPVVPDNPLPRQGPEDNSSCSRDRCAD